MVFDQYVVSVPAFLAGAAIVWWAGVRLPRYVAALSDRTGWGQGLAGILVLGGITSLPELATGTSAAALGAPLLSLNDILGSASLNLLLLALADYAIGARPLTSVVARPITLVQGVLGMMMFGVLGLAIGVGESDLGWPVGLWATLIFAGVVTALLIADHSEKHPRWQVINPPPDELAELHGEDALSDLRMWLTLVGLAAMILVGGILLANAGEAIARRSDFGFAPVGFLFVAAATSLPEASAITGAMRSQRYQLAVGEIFGSNLFNLAIIFAIDLVAPGAPVLTLAGTFEMSAAMLALLLTGIFVIGLIERRDRTLLRMGEDSIAVIVLYLAGTTLLLVAAR